jgi:hypothetical protein
MRVALTRRSSTKTDRKDDGNQNKSETNNRDKEEGASEKELTEKTLTAMSLRTGDSRACRGRPCRTGASACCRRFGRHDGSRDRAGEAMAFGRVEKRARQEEVAAGTGGIGTRVAG